MHIVTNIAELNSIRSSTGELTIALVPTMGALHDGHLSLVTKVQDLVDKVWVSIFVNPLQFTAGEDLAKYPRTLDEDCRKLEALGVDYVLAPSTEELYAKPAEEIKANPDLANRLCGLSRPGHFDGVCTVVKLLFDLVQPDIAIFGEKDYQQLKVIESMVQEYDLSVEIVPAPIIREANGLAMSSRNRYLSDNDRELAANIYKELQTLSSKLKVLVTASGELEYDQDLITRSKSKLEAMGIEVEYLETHWQRLLVAARIGATRLIDNITLN